MTITDFHKIRRGLQDNADPAPSHEVQASAELLRAVLAESGVFDDVEVEATADPDGLVIAMCRYSSQFDEEQIEQGLEWLWEDQLRTALWAAHGTLRDRGHVEFEGATRSSNGDYVTVHIVAQQATVPAQRAPQVERPARLAGAGQ